MAVHWFNPLTRLIARSMTAEAEMACDAAVMRYAGAEQCLSYSETILYTAKRGRQPTPALASAFTGGGKNLKKRLAAIVERKPVRRWVAVICAVVLLAGVLAAGLVSCGNCAASMQTAL